MRFLITVFSLFLFGVQLSAQSFGFNRLYAEAADCTPTRFEIIDEEYHVYCDCPNGENILITNLQGVQKSFALNTFNNCPVEGNISESIATFRVDKNEELLISQPNTYSIALHRFFGISCDEVLEQNHTYLFDANQQITATDIMAKRGSQGGIFISAYEYLGETAEAVPGPHTFRLWILKTDFAGNEIFRYQSPFDIYSLGTDPDMWIDQISYAGGAMVQFQQDNHSYPYFATVGPNNEHLFGGLIYESTTPAILKVQRFSLDGGRFYIEHTAGGGHSYRNIKKIKPHEDLGVFSAGGYGLDGNGTYTVTQAGGTITAARGYYDGMNVTRHFGYGDYSFTKNYLDLPIPSLIREAENGEALLAKSFGDEGLWILKTCYPDSEPLPEAIDIRINAIIPESIIPMPGEFFGTLYHPGYSPGEDYLIDATTLVSWYLSEDDLLDSTDTLLIDWEHQALLPFNENSFPFFKSLELPETVPTGTYYLLVKNDDSDLWVEENEENNLIAIPFLVFAASDSSITTTSTIEICEGDIFNDVVIMEDTTFFDTLTLKDSIAYITYESIVISEVIVLKNSSTKVDVVLETGSTFNGQIIDSDTIITEIIPAANGCDSLITTSIQVITNAQLLGKNAWNAAIFPNPTQGSFLLQFTLPKSQQLNFHLLNVQGQRKTLPLANQSYHAGEHQLSMDWSDHEPGIYFIGIEAEGVFSWVKLVLIK